MASGSGAGSTPANYSLNGVALGSQGTQPVVLPSLSIADDSATEPATGTANLGFVVTLSAASTSTVTVRYGTANGTAQAGVDYQSASGTLTFAPGQTSQTISVPVLGGVVGTSSKTFSVTLSNPSSATLARTQATGTITDNINPPPPTNGNFQYQLTSNWGSGMSAQITATNSSQQMISSWQLQFSFAANITDIWDATIESHVGNQYVIQNAGWNAAIAPGGSISFGFNASPGTPSVVPTGYVLGNVTSWFDGRRPKSPTPANDSEIVNPNQTTTINVLANDTDPAGYALSVTAITQPAHGSAVLNKDGTVSYTPKTGYTGADSFSYTVTDGHGGMASALVSLSVGTPAATAAWPAQFFAPYVDVTLYPTYNLVATTQAQGIKYYTLAFITADSNNQPAWGGYTAYEINGGAFDMALRQQVASVRSLGGDVMPSFGGAAGQELAQVITSVPQLTAAYQTVVTDYNVTHLDFDIEGAAEADHASIDRRSQALAALEQAAAAAGHPLQIWYTLPVLPTGLTADGLYVLQSALKYGVQLAGVNIMTMDYGDSAAPESAGTNGSIRHPSRQHLIWPVANPVRHSQDERPTLGDDRHHADDRPERRHERSVRRSGRATSDDIRPAEGNGANLDVVAQPRHARNGQEFRRRRIEQHHAAGVRLLENLRGDLEDSSRKPVRRRSQRRAALTNACRKGTVSQTGASQFHGFMASRRPEDRQVSDRPKGRETPRR